MMPVRSQISTVSLVESARARNTPSKAWAEAVTAPARLANQPSLITSRITPIAAVTATADVATRWPNTATPAITSAAAAAAKGAAIRDWADHTSVSQRDHGTGSDCRPAAA